MISGAGAGLELESFLAFPPVYPDKQALVPLHHAAPDHHLVHAAPLRTDCLATSALRLRHVIGLPLTILGVMRVHVQKLDFNVKFTEFKSQNIVGHRDVPNLLGGSGI